MQLAAALQQAENRNFPRRAPAALALTRATEIALVDFDFDFDLARKPRFLFGEFGSDQLAQLLETERRGVAVHVRQIGRRPGRGAGSGVSS